MKELIKNAQPCPPFVEQATTFLARCGQARNYLALNIKRNYIYNEIYIFIRYSKIRDRL